MPVHPEDHEDDFNEPDVDEKDDLEELAFDPELDPHEPDPPPDPPLDPSVLLSQEELEELEARVPLILRQVLRARITKLVAEGHTLRSAESIMQRVLVGSAPIGDNPDSVSMPQVDRNPACSLDAESELARVVADLELRFTYHKPKPGQPELYGELREEALRLARMIANVVPASREKSLAFTKLEEVVMWANAGIARRS